MSDRLSKRCLRCARPFTDRRKFKDFAAVKYCGERCRRTRFSGVNRRIAEALLELLEARGIHKTLCPSEVARRVQPEDWRPLMPAVREVARGYAAYGSIRFTQRGQTVDPEAHTGPVRLGLVDPRR